MSTITNVAALTAIVEFCESCGYDNAEAIAKVKRHIEQLSKPKAKSTEPTKTQRLNANLCEEVNAYLVKEGTATAKGVAENLGSPYITSSQKATIILGMLTAQGRAERHCEKGKVWWTPIAE